MYEQQSGPVKDQHGDGVVEEAEGEDRVDPIRGERHPGEHRSRYRPGAGVEPHHEREEQQVEPGEDPLCACDVVPLLGHQIEGAEDVNEAGGIAAERAPEPEPSPPLSHQPTRAARADVHERSGAAGQLRVVALAGEEAADLVHVRLPIDARI